MKRALAVGAGHVVSGIIEVKSKHKQAARVDSDYPADFSVNT